MAKTVVMLLVTDADGRVVAAAHRPQGGDEKMNVAFEPLVGQQVHHVEVPEELTTLTGRGLHLAFSQVRVQPGEARPTFKAFKTRHSKHE